MEIFDFIIVENILDTIVTLIIYNLTLKLSLLCFRIIFFFLIIFKISKKKNEKNERNTKHL